MKNLLVWQRDSNDLSNSDNLKAIARWWSNLNGKEISWQQRLIPPNGDLSNIDWQPQKFDEKLVIYATQLRGITLFWHSNQIAEERNITPAKMQLNSTQQQLLIVPQSQSKVVININLPKMIYQKIDLVNPQIAATTKNNQGIILLADESQKLEIRVTLDWDRLELLRDRLKIEEN